MKLFKAVKKYIFQYKLYMTIFIVFNIIYWIISILLLHMTGSYIDLLVEYKDSSIIFGFVIKILVLGSVSIISSFLVNYFYAKVQIKSAVDLNFDVLNHLLKLPILYFKDIDTAYLNQRINSDSYTLISFILGNILDIIIRGLILIFVLYISFKINMKLTLILMPLIPLYLVLYFIFQKPLFKYGYDLKEKQNRFFSKMNDELNNVNLIKVNATFEEVQGQLKSNFQKMFTSFLKYTRISYIFSSSEHITKILSQIIVLYFGGKEIINGNLTIGKFTIINGYFTMIMGCISYYLNLGKSYQDALVSYNRLEEIWNEAKEINGSKRIDTIKRIQLKNISFSYDGINNIIQNYDYNFEKGKIYSIIGKNGIGKSTFINLVLGLFNNYYEGEIYYNSYELKELDMYYLRKKFIGISEQEPRLINDTILNNLIYGIDIYSYDDIEILLSSLNLNEENFPNGVNTNVHEDSNNISGGEKLKISLTRTFLKNPDLIILDEPTSALDGNSIELLKNLLIQIKKDKIILVVTHNKKILDICDKIIDLDKIYALN